MYDNNLFNVLNEVHVLHLTFRPSSCVYVAEDRHVGRREDIHVVRLLFNCSRVVLEMSDLKVEALSYLCSENKDANHASLFSHMQRVGFLMTGFKLFQTARLVV